MSIFTRLAEAYEAQRLGHALLISHPSADLELLQKKPELLHFIMALTCQSRNACGTCESCAVFKNQGLAAAHPDFTLLAPESDISGYNVDQIRQLSQAFSRSRALSPTRVGLIFGAELLSTNGGAAANALLKLLEEPRPDSVLILMSAEAQGILNTLRSRCQYFRWNFAVDVLDPLRVWDAGPWSDFAKNLVAAHSVKGLYLPPDDDKFWSDRERALEELKVTARGLWARLAFDQLNVEQSRYVLDLFEAWESLIRAVRAYGNGALHWARFRSVAEL